MNPITSKIELAKISIMIICLCIFSLYGSKYFIKSEENHTDEVAVQIIENNAIREIVTEGDFKDRKGNIISSGTAPKENSIVSQDDEEAYAWLLGFNKIGTSPFGLKGTAQDFLYYTYDDEHHGSTIHLTTDSEIQRYAYNEILNGQYGSVVVIDNLTGEILCLASHGPVTFNINKLDDFLKESMNIEGSQYMPGVRETDPPGSTFKIITAAAALSLQNQGQLSEEDFDYYDTGEFYTDDSDQPIKNYAGKDYGQLKLQEAFGLSSNTYFANLGTKTGWDTLQDTAESFYIGKDIPIEFLNTLHSSFNNTTRSNTMLAFTSYGQGALAITPLHQAMIASAIANNGTMKQPYIVSKITSHDETKNVYTAQPAILNQHCTTPEVAATLRDIMHTTATDYYHMTDCGYVCAKTGTAECSDGRIHTYITGFTDRYSFCISINQSETGLSRDLFEPTQNLINHINSTLQENTGGENHE